MIVLPAEWAPLVVRPASGATFFPQTKEVLRRFVRRPHRNAAPAVVDLSKVVYQTIQIRSFDVVGGTAGVKTLSLPTEPLDFVLRDTAHTFLWQNNPFEAAKVGDGDPKSECLGVDLVLPYWMGRDRGAF